MTIKRTKFGLLYFGVLALSGFLLAPPQWPSIGVAACCGVLSGAIFIHASKSDGRSAQIIAFVLPLTMGRTIVRSIFFKEAIGRTAWGFEFQYEGVFLLVGCATILVGLTRRNGKSSPNQTPELMAPSSRRSP